jgi:hypothetical protein
LFVIRNSISPVILVTASGRMSNAFWLIFRI